VTGIGVEEVAVISEGRSQQKPIGLALALLDATRNGKRIQVDRLASMYGINKLIASVSELSERMVFSSAISGDVMDLISVGYVVSHGGYHYRMIATNIYDRRWPWAARMRYARGFGDALMNHYISCVENDTGLTKQKIRVKQGGRRWTRNWAAALGYFITVLANELAVEDNVDIETRIEGYRAYAAEEIGAG
jgi:hypothetical protein